MTAAFLQLNINKSPHDNPIFCFFRAGRLDESHGRLFCKNTQSFWGSIF